MVPFKFIEFIDTLTDLVKKNYIHMERIDDAVKRILRVKFIMGLFENPMADFSLVNELGSQVIITKTLFGLKENIIYFQRMVCSIFLCFLSD